VQLQLLKFSGAKFKSIDVSSTDRSLVWKLTKEKSYGVPLIRDGKKVIFESGDDSQDIAKYLDAKLKLNLFPAAREGEQSILWRYIENEIEGATFRLNDIYLREFVPKPEIVSFIRHKERKFGRGCIEQWRSERNDWLKKLEMNLVPFEQMLAHTKFLLDENPLFVDFDLFGMLENFLFTGHYQLPKSQPHLRAWHQRMKIQRKID
jgi:glutathione S-transferase